MVRLRAHFDADRQAPINPTVFKTEQNKNKVYCGMCGGVFFVEDDLFEEIIMVIKETSETPFLCKDCQEEYEELAHRY